MARCKWCKEKVEKPYIAGIFSFCSIEHAKDYAIANMEKGRKKVVKEKSEKFKVQKKKDRVRKKELRTRSEWYSIYQMLINQKVKIRDHDKPCCTCGTTNPNIKYDAGHFIAVKRGGVDPRRFEMTNIHKQCSVQCNQHGSGMRAEYIEFIRSTYGQVHLDWLECDANHQSLRDKFPHWTDIENAIIKARSEIRESGFTPVR